MSAWDTREPLRAETAGDVGARLAERDPGAPGLLPTGSGSTLSRGLPPSGPVSLLEMSSVNAVIEHIPEDLTVRVEAGVSLTHLQDRLREHNQWLPLSLSGGGSIGGWIGSGRRGPLSGSLGSIRDYLIGIRFVDGRGRDLRAGGQVVKNVAGYDLMKLMIGSLGEFGVVLEATFKVLPLPVCFGGVVLEGPDPEWVARTLPEGPGSWLPTALWRLGAGDKESVVAVFSGSTARVHHQVQGLRASWGQASRALEDDAIRDVLSKLEGWRAVPGDILGWGGALPTFWTETHIPDLLSGGEWAADLLGGHLWWRLPESNRERVGAARHQMTRVDGHLNQDVAPGGHPEAWGDSAMDEIRFWSRLKEALDPHHRLVSGRLPGGV